MKIRRAIVAAVARVATLGVVPAVAGVANIPSSPLAPASAQTYSELSAKWWQWTFSTPFSDNGPFGERGTNCGENQPAGDIWFLAGQFTGAPADRTCDVPAGKQLFLPVLNVECSNVEAAPFFGATVADRRSCVQQPDFASEPLYATLDGHPIVADLAHYRFTSPNFPFVAVVGNPAGVPEGRGFSVSTGVWLLLGALSPGEHVVTFSGTFPAFGFTPVATYHLTVE